MRKRKRTKSYGSIIVILYFIVVVILSSIFQINVMMENISLDFIPKFLRVYIFKDVTWFIMIGTLLMFWGISILQSKRVKAKFKVQEKYYLNIPTKLPPTAASIMCEDNYTFCLGSEFAYFLEKGFIEIIDDNGRTTFKANRYPSEYDGLWKYQVSLFDMFFREIAGKDGAINLEDLKNLENEQSVPKKYFFIITNIISTLQEELTNKGYIKDKETKALDLNDMADIFIALPFFYLCIAFVIMNKFLLSIPMIIYIIMTMFICKDRTGMKEKFTDKGLAEYKNIASFKMFLKNYTITEDRGISDLKVLKMFLVYASVFGYSDKLCNEMNKAGISDVIVSIIKPILNINYYINNLKNH